MASIRAGVYPNILNIYKKSPNLSFSSIKLKCYKLYVRHASRSSNFIQTLQERKLIQSIFPNENVHLPEVINSGVQCAYAGFDPTADSLHLGNLAIIMGLLHWTRSGHNAIALIGGGTAMIGDPSGQTSERKAAVANTVIKNSQKLQESLERIFTNYQNNFYEGKQSKSIQILNNITWYQDFKLIDFLSTVGRYFKLGEMLARTSVQSRLQSKGGISFCEFSYQVFQGFDWMHLLKTHNCHFQFGGMDQMGNIHGGRDVIHKVTKKNVYGLMLPLLLSEIGSKFGKTAGNAVWLDPEKTSPYELYQFFLRLPDDDVESYLGIFLFESKAEIDSLLVEHKNATERRLPHKRLAETVTLLVHGELGLQSAIKCTNALFHSTPDVLSKLSQRELNDVFQQAPSLTLEFKEGMSLLDLGLKIQCFSNAEDAQRIINRGGFYLNFEKITDYSTLISKHHILENGISLLRVGKRNYYLVNWK